MEDASGPAVGRWCAASALAARPCRGLSSGSNGQPGCQTGGRRWGPCPWLPWRRCACTPRGTGGREQRRGMGSGDFVQVLEKIKFRGVTLFLWVTQIMEWVSGLDPRCWRQSNRVMYSFFLNKRQEHCRII